MKNRIDFEDIKWGTLTRAQKAYHKEHPTKAKTVKSFAKLVERKPEDFSKKMEHKARFYMNIIDKK